MAAGDHERANALADTLVMRVPGHPNVFLLRATARGAAGRDSGALADIRTLLRWDARYARRALDDTSLRRLRPSIGERLVDSLADVAGRPIGRGAVWAIIDEHDLVPEGTAWDPATRSLLVGSLHKHKILAIGEDGEVTVRVAPGAHGLRSVVGIHVDSARGRLWVASAPRFDDPNDTTTAALFEFDASDGAFRNRYDAPPGPSFPNDLTTGPDGAVYLTDSRAGRVLVLRPGRGQLEAFDAAGPLYAPNGITISTDGRHLFVGDLDHVRVVSLADGRAWRLGTPDTINMAGIDGLAYVDGDLIAHHPLAFWRVVRYELDGNLRNVLRAEFIERNTPDARTSTTGEVGGGWYYYIGNGQLDRMNQRTIDSATMEPVRMYRVPLAARERAIVAVALSDRDSVALLDPQSLERIASLPVGSGPHELAASRDGRRIYVADAEDSSVTVLDISATPRVHATWRLPGGLRVHDVAVATNGAVWAAAGEPPLVVALDSATGVVRQRYAMQRPGSWLLDADGPGGAIVVAHLEGGAVTLLDPSSGEQTVLPGEPGEIDAVTAPARDAIWSVNANTGRVTVFEVPTGRRAWQSDTGAAASRVAFTADGRAALVVHAGDSTAVAYDVRRRVPVARVQVARGPKVIAISRDGRRAYVTHPHGALTLLDVPSMTVLRSVALPGTPDGVAIAEPQQH